MSGILKAESHFILSKKRIKVNDRRDTALKLRKIAWRSLFSLFSMDQSDVVD